MAPATLRLMLYADGWEAVDAIGSFGALVVAVGTSVVTSIGWWKSRGERDRLLTRDRRREREAQARQVVIGREDFTITTDDEVDPETGAPSHVEWRTRAIVFNGSSAPIAGMAVYVVFRDRDPSYVDGTDYFRPGRERRAFPRRCGATLGAPREWAVDAYELVGRRSTRRAVLTCGLRGYPQPRILGVRSACPQRPTRPPSSPPAPGVAPCPRDVDSPPGAVRPRQGR